MFAFVGMLSCWAGVGGCDLLVVSPWEVLIFIVEGNLIPVHVVISRLFRLLNCGLLSICMIGLMVEQRRPI